MTRATLLAAIETQTKRVREREALVDEARSNVDGAVSELQSAVRELNREAAHLAHLSAWELDAGEVSDVA